MKPAAFAYESPKTLAEALALLAELGDRAKVLAGGQSLIPMMNMRLAKPEVVVDLGRIPGLDFIRDDGDSLVLGALVRHRALETAAVIRQGCPVLSEAARLIGHFQIRERGTLGGTLAHADPTAEIPLIATLLDAEITIRSLSGERTATPADFFLSVFLTAMDTAELITAVRFRKLRPGEGWSVAEFARRSGDFALVAAAATLELDGGRIAAGRIALGGTGPTPALSEGAGALLVGELPSDPLFRAAAEQAAADIEPDSDLHATADDRRDLTRTLVFRALQEAAGRARATGGNER